MRYDSFFSAVGSEGIICFGAGKNANNMLNDPQLAPYLNQILLFVDNDQGKQRSDILVLGRAVPVCPPEMIREHPGAVVLITALDYHAMACQVEEIAGGTMPWFSWCVMNTREELEQLFGDKAPEYPRFILMNTPDYANLGDHAIAMAERRILRSTFQNQTIEIGSRLCHAGKELLPEYICKEDILLITGGGYMGSFWPYNNQVILDTVSHFPQNPVIVLPQSIYYGQEAEQQEALAQSRQIYNQHRKLLLCARENISHEFMKSYYPACSHLLVPDMALSLPGISSSGRRGIGACVRNDKESMLSKQIKYRLGDWHHWTGEPIVPISNQFEPEDRINHTNGEQYVLEKLCEYSQFQMVITDCLHGMVFSVITSTPCIAYSNAYHKNKGLYDTWLRDIPYLVFCDTVAEKAPDIDLNTWKFDLKSRYDNTRFDVGFVPLIEYIAQLEGVRMHGECSESIY